MKKSKFLILALSVLLVMLLALGVLVACDKKGDNSNTPQVTVCDLKYNMGTAPTQVYQVLKGSAVQANEIPKYKGEIPEGKYFSGWVIKGTDTPLNAGDIINESLELEAVIKTIQYTVEFVVGEETVSTVTLDWGVALAEDQIPEYTGTPSGKIFAGWVADNTTLVEAGYVPTADVVAVASDVDYSVNWEDYLGYYAYDYFLEDEYLYTVSLEVIEDSLVYSLNFSDVFDIDMEMVAPDYTNGGFTFTYIDEWEDEVTMWMFLDDGEMCVGEVDTDVEDYNVLEETEKGYIVSVYVYALNEDEQGVIGFVKVAPGAMLSTKANQINELLNDFLADSEGVTQGSWYDDHHGQVEFSSYSVEAPTNIYINVIDTIEIDDLKGTHTLKDLDKTAEGAYYYLLSLEQDYNATLIIADGVDENQYGAVLFNSISDPSKAPIRIESQGGATPTSFILTAGDWKVSIDKEVDSNTTVTYTMTATEAGTVNGFPIGGTEAAPKQVELEQLVGEHSVNVFAADGKWCYSFHMDKDTKVAVTLNDKTWGAIYFKYTTAEAQLDYSKNATLNSDNPNATFTLLEGDWMLILQNEASVGGPTVVPFTVTLKEETVGDFPAGGNTDEPTPITLEQLQGEHTVMINDNGVWYYSITLDKDYDITITIATPFVGEYSKASVTFSKPITYDMAIKASSGDGAVTATVKAGTYKVILNNGKSGPGEIEFTLTAVGAGAQDVAKKADYVGVWSDREDKEPGDTDFHQAFISLNDSDELVVTFMISSTYRAPKNSVATYDPATGKLVVDVDYFTHYKYDFSLVDEQLVIYDEYGESTVTLSKVTETGSKYEGTWYALENSDTTSAPKFVKIVVEKGGYISWLEWGNDDSRGLSAGAELLFGRIYDENGVPTIEYKTAYSDYLVDNNSSNNKLEVVNGNLIFVGGEYGLSMIYFKVEDGYEPTATKYTFDGGGEYIYDLLIGDGKQAYVFGMNKVASQSSYSPTVKISHISAEMAMIEENVYTLSYTADETVSVVVKLNATGKTYQKAEAYRGAYSGTEGNLVLDGFGGAKLGDKALGDYTYEPASHVVVAQEKSYKLDFDKKSYEVVTIDGLQGTYYLKYSDSSTNNYIKVDGFGGINAHFNYADDYGTYEKSTSVDVVKLTVSGLANVDYNGEYTLTNYGFTLHNDNADYTKAPVFENTYQGSYLCGDEKVIVTIGTHYFILKDSSSNDSTDVVNYTSEEGGKYKFEYKSTQYEVVLGASVTINSATVTAMRFPFAKNKYYAYHNMWELDTKSINYETIKYPGGSSYYIKNMNFYFKDGVIYYEFETNPGTDSAITWTITKAEDGSYNLSNSEIKNQKLSETPEETLGLPGVWEKDGLKLDFKDYATIDISGGTQSSTNYDTKGIKSFTLGDSDSYTFQVYGQVLLVMSKSGSAEYAGVYTQTSVHENVAIVLANWVGLWQDDTGVQIKIGDDRRTIEWKDSSSADKWTVATDVSLYEYSEKFDLEDVLFKVNINDVEKDVEMRYYDEIMTLKYKGPGESYANSHEAIKIVFDDNFIGNWQTKEGQLVNITISTLYYAENAQTAWVKATEIKETEIGKHFTFKINAEEYFVDFAEGKLTFAKKDQAGETLTAREADMYKDLVFTYIIHGYWSDTVRSLTFDGFGNVNYKDSESATPLPGTYYVCGNKMNIKIPRNKDKMDGEWDLLSGGYQFSNSEGTIVYSAPVRFEFTGYYTGSHNGITYLLLVDNYGFTLNTSTGVSGNVYNIKISGDATKEYTFEIEGQSYQLTVGDKTFKLGEAELNKVDMTGTYYANHNLITLKIEALNISEFTNKQVSSSSSKGTIQVALEEGNVKYTFTIGEAKYELKVEADAKYIVYDGRQYQLSAEAEKEGTMQGKFTLGNYTLTVTNKFSPYSCILSDSSTQKSYEFSLNYFRGSGDVTIDGKSYTISHSGNAYLLKSSAADAQFVGVYEFTEAVEVVLEMPSDWVGVWVIDKDSQYNVSSSAAVLIVGKNGVWVCWNEGDVENADKYEAGTLDESSSTSIKSAYWDFDSHKSIKIDSSSNMPNIYTSDYRTYFTKVTDYTGDANPTDYVAWLNAQSAAAAA